MGSRTLGGKNGLFWPLFGGCPLRWIPRRRAPGADSKPFRLGQTVAIPVRVPTLITSFTQTWRIFWIRSWTPFLGPFQKCPSLGRCRVESLKGLLGEKTFILKGVLSSFHRPIYRLDWSLKDQIADWVKFAVFHFWRSIFPFKCQDPIETLVGKTGNQPTDQTHLIEI